MSGALPEGTAGSAAGWSAAAAKLNAGEGYGRRLGWKDDW